MKKMPNACVSCKHQLPSCMQHVLDPTYDSVRYTGLDDVILAKTM